MAELIERQMGLVASRPPIPEHQFESLLSEWGRGAITGAQANSVVQAMCDGVGLNANEQAEAQAIVNTVTSIAVPAAPAALGNNPSANTLRDYTLAWAQRHEGRTGRALKMQEINHILKLGEAGKAPYDDPAFVRSRLGI